MHYTEKEQKGLDKVARMNRFFDKVLMPAIGVLIIITLLLFTAGRLMDKLGGEPAGRTAGSSAAAGTPQTFRLRAAVLANYETYAEAFADYGYEPAEGYAQDLALRKTVDEELVIFQFSDDALGDFTILRYTPKDSRAAYDSLSLTVSSSRLINVMVSGQDFEYTVAFTATDFAAHKQSDDAQYREMMKIISKDELTAMYALFEADIENLAQHCGVA